MPRAFLPPFFLKFAPQVPSCPKYSETESTQSSCPPSSLRLPHLILFDGFDWLAGKIAGVSGSGSLGGPTLDVSLEGVEKAGGAIAVDVAAQKAVRGAPRSTGQKVSLSMVGKTAAKVGKIAGWAGTLLTANDGRSAFQICMSNQD